MSFTNLATTVSSESLRQLYRSLSAAEAMNELTREVATIPYGSPAFKENRCKERNDELKGRISYLRLNSRICNNFVKFHVTPKTNAKSMKLCNMAWDALKTPERPTTEQVKYNLKVYDAVCSGDRFNLSSLVEEFRKCVSHFQLFTIIFSHFGDA